MSEHKIDWEKPLRSVGSHIPITLRYTLERPSDMIRRFCTWWDDGEGVEEWELLCDDTDEVENVPENAEYWVNIYRNDDGEVRVTSIPYRSCESASMDLASKGKRLCPPVKLYEEEVQP